MEKGKSRMNKYLFFRTFKGETPLERLFDKVFVRMQCMRMMVAPDVFGSESDEAYPNRTKIFYTCCLTELYFTAIVKNLGRWRDTAVEYNTEFCGKWKYYALSKRLDFLKEWGHCDLTQNDYHPDGTVITQVADEKLLSYTIVDYLTNNAWKDIFLQTEPEDLLPVFLAIQHADGLSIAEIIRKTGHKIKTYRRQDGEMTENTREDEERMEVENRLSGRELAEMLLSIVVAVRELIDSVKRLSRTEDHTEFFRQLPAAVDAIFECRVKRITFDNFKNSNK
jgi:hypothetical protein